MPNLVSFKVFLSKSSNVSERVEVRRFGIEQDVATSYSYLVEKLKTIFPCLLEVNETLNLYWKDSDNDKVALSSDSELIIALTEMEDPIKKIYIETSAASCNENVQCEDFNPGIIFGHGEGDGMGNFHSGIVCDGCDGSVIGFRYKCVQCSDFDLCSTCEAKGLHPEHLMLRMPNPASGILGVKVCDCSGKKKGKCCCDVSGRGSKDVAEYPFICQFSKRHGKKHWKHHGNRVSFLADSVARSFMDSITSGAAGRRTHSQTQQALQSPDSTTQEGPCKRHFKTPAQSNSNTNGHVPNANASADSAPGSTQTGNSNSGKTTNNNYDGNCNDFLGDLINNVGPVVMESLRKQNNPLIDFLNEIMPENNNRSNDNEKPNGKNNSSNESANNESQTEERPESNKTAAAVSTENVKENNSQNAKEKNEKSNAVFTIISDKDNDSSGTRHIKIAASDINKIVHDLEQLAVRNGLNVEQTAVASTSTVTPSAPTEEQSKDLNRTPRNDNDGIRVKAIGVEQKEEENGWTMLNDPSFHNESDNKTSKTTGSENINGTGAIPKTSLPKDSPSANQQNSSGNGNTDNRPQFPENVANGLHRMLAMGFTNEGNWLGDLLTKNNGDVTAVIDLLLPPNLNAFNQN